MTTRTVGIIGFVFTLVAVTLSSAQSNGEKKDAPKIETNSERIAALRKSLFTGGRAEADHAAPLLKQLGAEKLSDEDRESWVRVARDAAIRQGDRAWLESLKDAPDRFDSEMIYTVLKASGQLSKADFDGAKLTLSAIKHPEKINEREKRRIQSIRARIAQLEGDVKEERVQIEHLVDHLYLWNKPVCQSCHNNMNDPKAITSLPITNLWFGERFVELLQRQGDGENVRTAAESDLKSNPDDEKARIRFAFALRALKQDAEAEKQFRLLTWAEFPDRNLRKPRMMTAFP